MLDDRIYMTNTPFSRKAAGFPLYFVDILNLRKLPTVWGGDESKWQHIEVGPKQKDDVTIECRTHMRYQLAAIPRGR